CVTPLDQTISTPVTLRQARAGRPVGKPPWTASCQPEDRAPARMPGPPYLGAPVDSLLCVANFPASTGYAWTALGRMFAEVANVLVREGVRTLVAYPVLDTRPEPLAGSAAEPVGLDLSLATPRSISAGLELVLRENGRGGG